MDKQPNKFQPHWCTMGVMKVSLLVISMARAAMPALAQAESTPRPTPAASAAHSVWSIDVVGFKGGSLGNFTIELLDESAETCMSGQWKKARLIQSSFQPLSKQVGDKNYYPTYDIENQTLTIQLNSSGLCDAYMMLGGKFTEHDGKGQYFSLGLDGAHQLGTFTAERLPQ